MSKREIGPLEFEKDFPAGQELSKTRREILKAIRAERQKNSLQYHVSRIKNNGGNLVIRFKGEKIHHLFGLSSKGEKGWLPTKYTLIMCIPEDVNLYEEIEKGRQQLERWFGEDYKTSVLLPVIYTPGDPNILVVLLCKKNK